MTVDCSHTTAKLQGSVLDGGHPACTQSHGSGWVSPTRVNLGKQAVS